MWTAAAESIIIEREEGNAGSFRRYPLGEDL